MIIKAFPLSAYITTSKPNQLRNLAKRLINKGSMKYKPLPNNLTIKKSKIEGLGLFATKDIKKNINLGMMRIIIEPNEVIRTPLGGFINHNNKPNCIKAKESCIYDERIYLVTNRLIKKGEELTVKYTMYKV